MVVVSGPKAITKENLCLADVPYTPFPPDPTIYRLKMCHHYLYLRPAHVSFMPNYMACSTLSLLPGITYQPVTYSCSNNPWHMALLPSWLPHSAQQPMYIECTCGHWMPVATAVGIATSPLNSPGGSCYDGHQTPHVHFAYMGCWAGQGSHSGSSACAKG